MSANPNNPEARWVTQPAKEPAAVPTPADDLAHDAGPNALQALLAFACLHEQAARHRAWKDSATFVQSLPAVQPLPPLEASPSSPLRRSPSKEEEFALDEVLQLVAARAVAITGADGVAIGLAGENAIVCRASFGRIAPDKGIKLDPDAGFSGACLSSGQTVRCDDSDTDPRVNANACRALGARSMIAVPLSAKNRVVGLLEAFSTETSSFNDTDVRSLNLLGELILAAIRPEEEDRLAELARKVVVLPPALTPESTEIEAAAPHAPAKVIVDEKFIPLPKATAPAESAIEAAATPVVSEADEPLFAEVAPAVLEPAVIETPFPELALIGGQAREGRSVSSILLIAAIVLIVIGAAGAGVWKWRYSQPSISASTQPAPTVAKTDLNAQPVQQTPAPEAPEAKPGAISAVTGIQHSSAEASSTVVINLQDSVHYEEHRLDNPSRIYLDLYDTRIAAGPGAQEIEVNDAFLKRIRMAQPSDGVTRVVLETKQDSPQYSVSLDSNPYRLTIEVHKAAAVGAGATPALKTPPVNLPKPSPAIIVAPKKAAEAPKLSEPKATESTLKPTDFQIVLDAGHGGWDLGTVGKKGLLEKDLVLDIVQRLGKLIETKLGAQVIYTRQDDSYLPLEKRAEIANVAKADMFLSVHANYSDLKSARGVETYYTTTYSSIKARTDDASASLNNVDWTGVDIREKVTDSHRLAADIQQALYGGLAVRNPDIRDRGVKEAQYVVLTGTQMPAVLAEVSFVSSPADETQLENSAYRQLIAEALYKGVARYRKEVTSTKVASAQKAPH